MKRKYSTRLSPVYLQEDRVRYYHARISREYKESNSVKCLSWSTHCLDLSPIENLWNKLKRNITKRHHRIKGISEMEQVLREEWSKIDKSYMEKLINSMDNRLQDCIKAKGASTRH